MLTAHITCVGGRWGVERFLVMWRKAGLEGEGLAAAAVARWRWWWRLHAHGEHAARPARRHLEISRVGSGRVGRFSNSHWSGRITPYPTRPDLAREV